MTEQEIVELEIERRALLVTANEMSRGDACIDIERREMVEGLRRKAEQIKLILNDFVDYTKVSQYDATYDLKPTIRVIYVSEEAGIAIINPRGLVTGVIK